ncbi:MAG TPA: fibronectin type III domain-containing protein, partial [Elusimicrobiales bacterium]|nr:fibronectin type III domain-containing protein [Elusimicrobiales bacterium]
MPGQFLNIGEVATGVAPPTPAEQSFVSVSANSFTMQWAAGGNPPDTSYRAAISTTADFTTEYSTETVSTAISFIDLATNTTYYAHVAAIGRNGQASSYLVLGATATFANAPVDLFVVPVSSYSISMEWSANQNPIGTRYEASYSTVPDFTEEHSLIFTTHTVLGVSGLAMDTVYYFKVRAVNHSGVPSESVFSSTRTLEAPPPSPPSIASIASGKDGIVYISWSIPPEGATYYRLFRSSVPFDSIDPQLEVNSNIGTTTYQDIPQTDGTYYYAVVAVDSRGKASQLSSLVSGISDRTAPLPPDMLNSSVDIAQKHISVAWTAVPDSVAYNIYRSTHPVESLSGMVPLISASTGLVLVDLPAEDARYSYMVTALDALGNESSVFVSTEVIFDVHAPAINISGIANGGYYAHSVSPALEITDFSPYVSTVTLNGETWMPGSAIVNEGRYILSVLAQDIFASSSSATRAFTIDKTSPTLSVSYPSNGAVINGVVSVVLVSSDNFTPAGEIMLRDSQGRSPPFLYSEDGVYLASFTATDLAGNRAFAEIPFIVDQTSPSVVNDLSVAVSSGVMLLNWTSPGDNLSGVAGYIVRSATFSLTEANFINAQDISGAPVPLSAGSPQSFSLSLSTAATRFFALKSSDTAGNFSQLSNVAYLDADGPALSALSPGAGVRFSRPGTISLQASDLSGIAGVSFLIDGLEVFSSTIAPFAYYWNTLAYEDGEHQLVIRATDTVGNVSDLTAVYDLRYGPPAVPVITAPVNKLKTTAAELLVSGTAEPGIAVEIKINNFSAGTVYSAPNGSFTLPVVLFGEGTQSITATAKDGKGNSIPSSPVTVYYNLAAPSAPLSLMASSLAGGKLQLAWTNGTGKVPSYYNVYRSTYPEAYSSSEAPASNLRIARNINVAYYNDLPPSDGVYYYGVTACDSSDNESGSAEPAAAVSDRQVPTTAIAVDGGAAVIGPGTHAVSMIVSKTLVSAPVLMVKLPGQPVSPVDLSPYSSTLWGGTLSISSSNASGTAQFSFEAIDLVGNVGSIVSSGAALTIDTQPPLAAISIDPASPVKSGTVTVHVSVEKSLPIPPTLSCMLPFVGIVPISLEGSGKDWTGYFDIPIGENGGAYFVYSATDTLANVSSVISSGANFVVDTIPPGIPLFIRTASLKGGSVRINWSAPTGEAARYYAVYRGGVKVSGNLAPATDGSGSYMETLADGNYEYSVSAIDAAGNEGLRSESVSAVARSTPPQVPSDCAISSDEYGHIVLAWTQLPDSSLAGFRVYRATWAFDSVSGIQNFSASASPYVDSPVINGSYYYRVSAMDFAGNESALSVSTSAYWGKSPPVISISGATDNGLYNHAVSLGYFASDLQLDPTSLSGTLNGAHISSGYQVSSEGSYVLDVYAANLSGAGSTRTLHFDIDLTPPAVSISGIEEGKTYRVAVIPQVSASDLHLSSVTLMLDGAAYVSGAEINGNGSHAFTATAYDLAGNSKSKTVNFVLAAPPSAPGNALLSSQEGVGATLSWSAPAADLAGYRVYKNGSLISQGLVTATQFKDTSYSAGTAAIYEISAMDEEGQEGQRTVFQLPALSFALESYGSVVAAGTRALNKGYFDAVNLKVSNAGTQEITAGPAVVELLSGGVVISSATASSVAVYGGGYAISSASLPIPATVP